MIEKRMKPENHSNYRAQLWWSLFVAIAVALILLQQVVDRRTSPSVGSTRAPASASNVPQWLNTGF
jgi:type II secretory pathway component PulK